jgi:cell division protein FtsL
MQVELSDLAALGHEIQLEEQGLNRYDRIKLIAEKRLGLTDVKPHQIVKE